jgi:hypothetical protein
MSDICQQTHTDILQVAIAHAKPSESVIVSIGHCLVPVPKISLLAGDCLIADSHSHLTNKSKSVSELLMTDCQLVHGTCGQLYILCLYSFWFVIMSTLSDKGIGP